MAHVAGDGDRKPHRSGRLSHRNTLPHNEHKVVGTIGDINCHLPSLTTELPTFTRRPHRPKGGG